MRQDRLAFTLMEVVLVLAIIVLLIGLSYPSIEGMYGNYRVQAAADQVRARWAEARSQAVDEGRAYRFAVIRGKGNFRLAPDSAEFWSNGNGMSNRSPSSGSSVVIEDALPRGIRFTVGDAANDDDDGDSTMPADQIGNDMWTGVVTFLPDGTATTLDGAESSEVRIIFRAKNASPMMLKLRTLTGAVSARQYYPEENGP